MFFISCIDLKNIYGYLLCPGTMPGHEHQQARASAVKSFQSNEGKRCRRRGKQERKETWDRDKRYEVRSCKPAEVV